MLEKSPRVSASQEFTIRSAFAEYLVLPELRQELRIILASYDSSCDEFRLPEAEELKAVITVATPPAESPAAKTYAWSGHEAHGGTPERPEKSYALPHVRIGSRPHELRPGGGVELKEVRLSEGGQIRGILSFEFPGDADHPAQGLHGGFTAKVCSASPVPGETPAE